MPELLTSLEVATLLRISRKTLERYRKRHLINFIVLRGKIVFRRVAVELFLAQREVRGKSVAGKAA